MELLVLLVKFFGGLLFLSGVGYLVGHFLNLEKYWEIFQVENKKKHITK